MQGAPDDAATEDAPTWGEDGFDEFEEDLPPSSWAHAEDKGKCQPNPTVHNNCNQKDP